MRVLEFWVTDGKIDFFRRRENSSFISSTYYPYSHLHPQTLIPIILHNLLSIHSTDFHYSCIPFEYILVKQNEEKSINANIHHSKCTHMLTRRRMHIYMVCRNFELVRFIYYLFSDIFRLA